MNVYKESGMVLSLDISTSVIGWAITSYSDDGINLIDCGAIRPPKVGGIAERLFPSIMEILEKTAMYYPEVVVIEEPLISSNNAKTCALLNRANGLVSGSVMVSLTKNIEYISSGTARKLLGLEPKGKEVKQLVYDKISSMFTLPYFKDNVKYDVTDAILIGCAYWKQLEINHYNNI